MGNHRGLAPELVALVLALVLALGCARPPAPAPPAPVTATTKYYQPLEMRRDARLPGVAVILGTDERNGSTVLQLPAPRTVIVDAMFVSRDRKPATGALIAVRLTTASNPGSTARTLEGSAAWQAALSNAALVAAAALGKDLADLVFSAGPEVPSDAPAASALIAVGLVATLTGDDVDPAATLSGAIQPDGTIGPVADLPEQLVAALGRGKTRIGIPAGMRVARSAASGRDVDLAQLAKARHAEVIEIASLHDAYRLMTRKPLPAAVAVGEAEMAVEGEALDGLRSGYLAWQKRLAGQWSRLLQLEQSGRLPAVVKQLARSAHERSAQGEALYRAGKLIAAYHRMRTAWVYATSANDTYGVLAKLQAGDIDGATAVLTTLEADARAGESVARIGELRPSTLPGHLAVIAALQTALRGASHRALAVESLHATAQLLAGLRDRPKAELGAPSTAEAVASSIAPAALRVRRSIADLTLTEQQLALSPDRGAAYAASPGRAKQLADAFRDAAAAMARHLDALLVEPARANADARGQVAVEEPDALVASQLARQEPAALLPEIASGDGSPAAMLLPLAAYQLAYHRAALLGAKHALTVDVDDAGKITSIEPAPAFRQLVASAKRSALGFARAARVATGEVPLQARLAYQLALVDETGDLADQLDALAGLRLASAFSQTAVMLARN